MQKDAARVRPDGGDSQVGMDLRCGGGGSAPGADARYLCGAEDASLGDPLYEIVDLSKEAVDMEVQLLTRAVVEGEIGAKAVFGLEVGIAAFEPI